MWVRRCFAHSCAWLLTLRLWTLAHLLPAVMRSWSLAEDRSEAPFLRRGGHSFRVTGRLNPAAELMMPLARWQDLTKDYRLADEWCNQRDLRLVFVWSQVL